MPKCHCWPVRGWGISGSRCLAWFLVEEGAANRWRPPGADAQQQAARGQVGVSPVSFQSGKLDKARSRWACDVVLRHTGPLWADCSRKKSPGATA